MDNIDKHMETCKKCQEGINRFLELQKKGFSVIESMESVEEEGYMSCFLS